MIYKVDRGDRRSIYQYGAVSLIMKVGATSAKKTRPTPPALISAYMYVCRWEEEHMMMMMMIIYIYLPIYLPTFGTSQHDDINSIIE